MAKPSLEFPYFPVQFNKEGAVTKPQSEQSAVGAIPGSGRRRPICWSFRTAGTTICAKRGPWYENFLKVLRLALQTPNAAGVIGRTFTVLGVLWPSKKFADEELIPSGAAGVGAVINTGACGVNSMA